MDDDPDDSLLQWYDEVAAALRDRPPATVVHELPGLVDRLTEEAPDVDHYVVGVSFTKKHSCLDYAIDRVLRPDGDAAGRTDDEPVVESVKAPASERHRYVHFVHPPDPHFDAAALRARLLGAIVDERRNLAHDDPPDSTFADLWEQL